jgi:HNH endonuclease
MNWLEIFYRQIHPRIRYFEECWIFSGPTKNGTHGCVKVGGRKGPVLYTHRIAYQAFHRPLASGEVVMHKCNTPRCCNPEHLQAGSQSENMKYAYETGAVGRQSFLPGASGIVGVHTSTVSGHSYWVARGQGHTLYHGKDFFEACCARKSWEAA